MICPVIRWLKKYEKKFRRRHQEAAQAARGYVPAAAHGDAREDGQGGCAADEVLSISGCFVAGDGFNSALIHADSRLGMDVAIALVHV